MKFNEGHIVEGLDRLNTVMVMLHMLDGHPAIVKAGLVDNVNEVQERLMDMYQQVGNIEEWELLHHDVRTARTLVDKLSTTIENCATAEQLIVANGMLQLAWVQRKISVSEYHYLTDCVGTLAMKLRVPSASLHTTVHKTKFS